MTFEDVPLGLDCPSPPLGILEAIELRGYPETHLRVFQPEQHQAALESLVRRALNTMAVDVGRLVDDKLPGDQGSDSRSEQLVSDLGAADKLTVLLFEDGWARPRSLLGYMSLRQVAEDRLWHRATFSALMSPEVWAKNGVQAAESLFAYGLERWGLRTVIQKDAVCEDDVVYQYYLYDPRSQTNNEYDLRYTKGARDHFLQRVHRLYSSRFGVLEARRYELDAFCQPLSEDIGRSQKEVVLNGLHMTRQVQSDLVASCQSAVKNGIYVEMNIPYAPLSEEAKEASRAFYEAGVNVQIRSKLPKLAVIDRRIWWEQYRVVLEPASFCSSDVRRVESQRQIPASIIQDGTLM